MIEMEQGAERQQLRLSHLTAKIGELFTRQFGSRCYWVVAEISNCNPNPHRSQWFFECVEKSSVNKEIIAKVSCMAWRMGIEKIRAFEKITGQPFTNGIEVLLNVQVEYHPVYGLKLCLQDIDPQFTIGALELARQQTIERLLRECSSFIRKEGDRFITNNNQLPLPQVLQHIAIISSQSAAGYEDFKHTLSNNAFGYKFDIDSYYTYVQGEANSIAVYNTLLQVFHSNKAYDIVVIIRGGGSQTDLLIFDQFDLAKIVAKFPMPIITGIGHQKNETIVDMMAHTATTAPTKAAEFIIAHNRAFDLSLEEIKKHIIIRSQQRLSRDERELNRLKQLFGVQLPELINNHKVALEQVAGTLKNRPALLLANYNKDVEVVNQRFRSAIPQYIRAVQSRIDHHVSMFRVMSPVSIMKKGFALIKIDGMVVADPQKVHVGKDISIILNDTQLEATVIAKRNYNGNEFDI